MLDSKSSTSVHVLIADTEHTITTARIVLFTCYQRRKIHDLKNHLAYNDASTSADKYFVSSSIV